MIKFTQLKYKNFLSTGENGITLDLNGPKSTLVVGTNGTGKSTMLDALSFALFGKPHRNINKPQLVNSINKKNCLVEVDFMVGRSNFKVIRGIKPGIFEIWQNGELLNQAAKSLDYQKYLEQNILKLNHKSFHQIVVLGASSFTPFMQLPANNRRLVIEDLLDINIFSKMNTLLKNKNTDLRDRTKEIEYNIDIIINKISAQNRYINDITAINKSQVEGKNDKLLELKGLIDDLLKANDILSKNIEDNFPSVTEELKRLHDRKQLLLNNKHQINVSMKALVKDTKFYVSNDTCPSCDQKIDEDIKKKKIGSGKSQAAEFAKNLKEISDIAAGIEKSITRCNNNASETANLQQEINSNIRLISSHQKEEISIQDEINNKQSYVDLTESNSELNGLIENKSELIDSKSEISDIYTYNSAMAEMLKDTGIKTKVIKQYVPVINNLVNQYLQVLDFFVLFNLDENFQETIRSRHRDIFSYNSFSEGEKTKIDISLLFTWRQIAKMKNSVSTNLLILDETFDASLDHESIKNLTKIIYLMDDNSNCFIITHKKELDGEFDKTIEFYTHKGFSKYK